MRLLILGGTVFLGKHVAESALARDHQVTLFNRGQTHPDRFPEAEHWSATATAGSTRCGPRVRRGGRHPRLPSARRARPRRSCSATPSALPVRLERLRLRRPRRRRSTRDAGRARSPTRASRRSPATPTARSRRSASRPSADVAGSRRCIVRPGLIVGPDDPTDRFTYWPVRVARRRRRARPGPPEPALPGDRRARSRRLDGRAGRAGDDRRAERRRPGPAGDARIHHRDLRGRSPAATPSCSGPTAPG